MVTYTTTISFGATSLTPLWMTFASGGQLELDDPIAQRFGINGAQSVKEAQMERGCNVSRTRMVLGFHDGSRPGAEQV